MANGEPPARPASTREASSDCIHRRFGSDVNSSEYAMAVGRLRLLGRPMLF